MEKYYQILDLEPGATKEQIKSAYKKKALRYHPDKNPSPDAAEIFKNISEAYQVLTETPEEHNSNVPPQTFHRHMDPSELFKHFFASFEQPFAQQPFTHNASFSSNFQFSSNLNHSSFSHMNVSSTQTSISIQNGRKVETIVQNQNGNITTRKIVTDLQTNTVIEDTSSHQNRIQ
jgi:curved DNA-binding protein CbpA